MIIWSVVKIFGAASNFVNSSSSSYSSQFFFLAFFLPLESGKPAFTTGNIYKC